MSPMNPMSDMNPVNPVNRLWLLRHAMVEGAPGLCYGASDLVARPVATHAVADDFARRWPAESGARATQAATAATTSAAAASGATTDAAALLAAATTIDAVAPPARASSAGGMRLRCSPLRRCTALAAAVVERLPELGPVELDSRLAEMDFGAWEGQSWDAIGREAMDAWLADFADGPVGGHGESTRAFMDRVGAAWEAWRASGRDAVWVTHAGVMRAVLLLQQGIRCPVDAAAWPRRSIAFGEWLCIEMPAARA